MKHIFSFSLALLVSTSAFAHGINTKADVKVKAEFDIVKTEISVVGQQAVFRMEVSGQAGASKPAKSGKLAGSRVFSYVWPTSLDPAEVGFEKKTGILAFAVTAHPDFDDTPLFDENGNSNNDDDGDLWHSHWVVLVPDEACGPKALKVKDIAPGAKPKLPLTWPGLPIFIDSPGYTPALREHIVEVKVPFANLSAVSGAKFDGVTSGLRINASVHAPLLCIENVFKVASGDLSLPGQVK